MNEIKLQGEIPQIIVEDSLPHYAAMLNVKKNEQKKQNFRFWLPLIVSNSISIAALLVAILAYIKK